MNINIISIIKDGEYKYNFSEPAENFEIKEYSFKDDVNIRIILQKSVSQILAKVSFDVMMNLSCDWCADDFDYKLESEFEIVFKYDFSGLEVDIKNDDDDIRFISPHQRELDFKEDIHDYILLSVPMKKTPGEKDGVCLFCDKKIESLYISEDVDETISPVWEKLLKNKKN